MADSSSAPPNVDKPVIVRVKRKAFQSVLDAFWLEIHERPLKRALHDLENLSIADASSSSGREIQERTLQQPGLDFNNLSVSGASSSRVEQLRSKKILVRHVKTVASSEVTFDVLQSFVPNSSADLNSKEKNEERRRCLKTVNKKDPLRVKSRQRQEVITRHARFEQIWRSRKGKGYPEEEAAYDMWRLYDVVRIDVEEEHVVEVQNEKPRDTDLDDYKMMAGYLPLLRETLPSAAEEIESDIQDLMANQASSDGYVYDIYAVKEDVNEVDVDSTSLFPLVQVDDIDDDFYDGLDDTEYETDDSNAENNPLNDYPDEETSDDEDEFISGSSDEELEVESRASGSESEEELGSGSQVSYKDEGSEAFDWSDNDVQSFDNEMDSAGGDGETYW